MKKAKDSNPTSNGTKTAGDSTNNEVRLFRCQYMDIVEKTDFHLLSVHAQLLFLYVLRHPNLNLGIGLLPIGSLAAEINRDPNQFQVALSELQNNGLAKYDHRTHTLWINCFYDFTAPPNKRLLFKKYLKNHFAKLKWSPIKQECGRDLLKRSKIWFGEGNAFEDLIKDAMHKPRRKQPAKRKQATVLRLVNSTNK